MIAESTNAKAPVQLKENIFQLNAKCKIYLIRGKKRNILIDSGLPSESELIEQQLQELGLSKRDINIVILTHEHIDHIGGVPYFSAGTIIAAHSLAANKVELQDEFVLMSKAFSHSVDDFHIDIHLHHGTIIDLGGCVLQVLHTPGHCSGAICLYEPTSRVLFTGDTIFAGGTLGGIFPSGNISDYVLTLKQLSKLKINELYPGHGRISTRPDEDIEKAINASVNLINDTKFLFDALNAKDEFAQVMKSVSTYSKRV
ncbi:MAG: MBL fold metallo-hydrolase [Nitrospirae bacterium]|nr:MBL fold metallo-hydrolase [Nitrospirota bacterium]